MPAQNDFLAFATGGGANVIDQATYAAASYVGSGRLSGILPSNVYNKIARQGSIGAAMLAQFIVNQLGQNVLDNGNLATLVSQLTSAIQQAATIKPNRTVTTAAPINLLVTDYQVNVNNTSGAGLTINCPTTAVVGQEFCIEDFGGNASNAAPLNITANAGTTFKNGRAVVPITEFYGTCIFSLCPANLWGFKLS